MHGGITLNEIRDKLALHNLKLGVRYHDPKDVESLQLESVE
jgi:hypothetical protein